VVLRRASRFTGVFNGQSLSEIALAVARRHLIVLTVFQNDGKNHELVFVSRALS
jgi:hypothetical protein